MMIMGVRTAWAVGIAETLPMKTVFEQKQQISIPITPDPGKATVNFAAPLAQKGGVLCIKFRAFMNTTVPEPCGNYLRFTLNGIPLGADMPDGTDRLLNRGRACSTVSNPKMPWWDNMDALLVFFGLESELDKNVLSPRAEGYWYVFNISDASNYTTIGVDDRIEGGKPNSFVFENLYGAKSACHEVVIKDVSIGYVPQEILNKLSSAGIPKLPKLTGKTLAIKGSSLVVAKSGAMALKIGKDQYALTSTFSYPGKTIGHNPFSWEGKGAAEWKTRVTSAKSGAITVVGESKGYSVTRKITSKDGKFFISDTIQNRTDAPLGMSIRYHAFSPKIFASGDTNLCGVVDSHRMETCAANPTIFARQAGSSMGIVCQDTLLRMQLVAERSGNSIQFGTDHFGLAPHAKYTMEWALYPSTGRDYFGFINHVRRDWNVNFTIPGPASFSTKSIPGRKIDMYMMKPWFLYANGVRLNKEEYKALQKPHIAELLAAQPNAIPMAMVETNLVPVKRTDIKNGDQIPTVGTYGVELNGTVVDSFKAMPWYDSMIKTPDGRPYVDTYYSDPPFVDLLVYPAKGNHQLKYLLSQIDYLMDEVGFKGIYLDQFELASTPTGMGRADYSKWDGHTVDLDSQGQISRKYTDAAYVGTSARAEIINHVHKKGGVLITNGHTYSRETANLGSLNFSETEWDVASGEEVLNWNEPPALPSISEAHLDSPIGLGIRPSRFGKFGNDHFAEVIHKWVITFLKNGILYYYYEDTMPATGTGAGEYGELNHMFPFTPVELHAGWIVGKERIITAKSGSFVWAHKDKPVVLVFDIKGMSKTPHAKIIQHGQGWLVKLKISDWHETAVIKSAAEKSGK